MTRSVLEEWWPVRGWRRALGVGLVASVWRYRMLVVAAAVTSAVAGYGLALLEPETYEAVATIVLADARDREVSGSSGPPNAETYVAAEAARVTSQPVLARAAEQLGGQLTPGEIRERKRILGVLRSWAPPPALGVPPDVVNEPFTVMLWGITTETVQKWLAVLGDGDAAAERKGVLQGLAASPGQAEGVARVITSFDQLRDVQTGDILVCPITAPSWAPVFSRIRATVTDIGGIMSHAAIICREYGLPAVVGTGFGTKSIKTGQRIRVDGHRGTVTVLASLDRGLKAHDPALIEGWRIRSERLDELTSRIVGSTSEDREGWLVLGKGRSDIVVAGTLVIRRLARRFRSAGLVCSTHGLRYGLARMAAAEWRGGGG